MVLLNWCACMGAPVAEIVRVYVCMNVTVLVGDGSVASSKDACHINHALNSLLSLSHTHRVDACVCVCVR